MLGRHHEEGRAEQRVGAGGEDGVVDAHLRAGEGDLGALGAADPVALHRLDVMRPVDRVEVVQQAVGVVGDAEEPLLQLAQLDGGAAALAVAVDDLLVGQHGGVLGTPVDRGLLAVGQAALEQLQEDPLGPAVVARLVGAELARPVDRDAPGAELALEGGDRGVGGGARVLPGLDRVVLRGQAERVVAHRVQDAHAVAAAEVRDGVTDGVVLQVPHVGLAGRVREHLEHVGARGPVVDVGDFPGALALPDRLPFAFDLVRLVTMLGHWARRLASNASDPGCGAGSNVLAGGRREGVWSQTCRARRLADRPSPDAWPDADRDETISVGATSDAGRRRPRRRVRDKVSADVRVPWGYSSAGRARDWQSRGRRFEPG